MVGVVLVICGVCGEDCRKGWIFRWFEMMLKRSCYRGYIKFSLLSVGIIGWAWVRPTLVCSMSSLSVCSTSYVVCCSHLSWSLISCTYCHHIYPLSCPSLSPSLNKSVQQHDHTCQWRKRERTSGHWDSGSQSHHIVLPTHCHLTHAHTTVFCVYLVKLVVCAGGQVALFHDCPSWKKKNAW